MFGWNLKGCVFSQFLVKPTKRAIHTTSRTTIWDVLHSFILSSWRDLPERPFAMLTFRQSALHLSIPKGLTTVKAPKLLVTKRQIKLMCIHSSSTYGSSNFKFNVCKSIWWLWKNMYRRELTFVENQRVPDMCSWPRIRRGSCALCSGWRRWAADHHSESTVADCNSNKTGIKWPLGSLLWNLKIDWEFLKISRNLKNSLRIACKYEVWQHWQHSLIVSPRRSNLFVCLWLLLVCTRCTEKFRFMDKRLREISRFFVAPPRVFPLSVGVRPCTVLSTNTSSLV